MRHLSCKSTTPYRLNTIYRNYRVTVSHLDKHSRKKIFFFFMKHTALDTRSLFDHQSYTNKLTDLQASCLSTVT